MSAKTRSGHRSGGLSYFRPAQNNMLRQGRVPRLFVVFRPRSVIILVIISRSTRGSLRWS